jgi:hypothetical protein
VISVQAIVLSLESSQIRRNHNWLKSLSFFFSPALTSHKDPLFSDVTEEQFDALRAHILLLEQESEAERK